MHRIHPSGTLVPLLLVSLIGFAQPLHAALRCVPLSHPGPCDARYATIQEAVDQSAPSGDTVKVAAGTFAEHVVVVGKSLQLLGGQEGVDARGRIGAESTIVHPDGPLTVCGNDVVVDGFTLTGATSPTGSRAGITLDQSPCGATGGARIENNIVRDNIVGMYVNGASATKLIRANWIKDNASIPAFGTGIESDARTANLRIESNLITGNPAGSMLLASRPLNASVLSDNRFDRSIVLVGATATTVERNVFIGVTATSEGLIVLDGGANQVHIQRNTLRSTSGRAIVLGDSVLAGPNQAVTARQNCIAGAGLVGLEVTAGSYSGNLDATDNWWGSTSGPSGNGPGTGASVVDPAHQAGLAPFHTDEVFCDCLRRPEGAACDSGQICSAIGSCVGGSCVVAQNGCDDENLCTEDQCNPDTGACEHVPIECHDAEPCPGVACYLDPRCASPSSMGLACQDPDLCWMGGTCAGGACVSRGRDCNDGNPCTADSCAPGGQCVHTAAVVCDDGNPCTDDSCNPASGSCVFVGDDTNSCALPHRCTVDVCNAGACVATGPASCDDGVACTVDRCNTATGFCTNEPFDYLCGPTEQCRFNECDTVLGCTFYPRNTGLFCNDFNDCTVHDRCGAGSCSGIPVNCGSCGHCDHIGGACVLDPCRVCYSLQGSTYFPVPCNTPCMTLSGNCIALDECILAPDPGGSCTDGNPYTSDRCNASGQCASTNIPPVEITGVTFGADRATLAWAPDPRQAPGIQYEVASGLLAGLPLGSGPKPSCKVVGEAALATSDVPRVGSPLWYLVRSRDNYGVGSYGYAHVRGSPPLERAPACP